MAHYSDLVSNILSGVGGQENIENVYCCLTRLRFTLKDESKADEDLLQNIDGILSVIKAAGQYQLVIGQNAKEIYKELAFCLDQSSHDRLADDHASSAQSLEIDHGEDRKTSREKVKKETISSRFIDVISGVFTPILGLLTATGIIKGIVTLLLALKVVSTTSGTYQVLQIAGDCFFYFMPVFLGYSSMKKFGGTPFIGMALGAGLLYPSIATIMAKEPLYLLFENTIFETPVHLTFCGIPVLLMNYASSVIPIVVICFFAAKVERGLSRVISDLFKSFAVPAITIVVSLIPAIMVVGPLTTFMSSILRVAFVNLFAVSPLVCGLVYGGIIQLCVMFGVHWGFVAIAVNNLATLGYDPLTITGLASAFAQAGAAAVIMLKTKDKALKRVCGPAIISTMVGITEPVIYGVTLRFKKPFILASIAAGLGGAIMGFGNVRQYVFGVGGLFGWIQVINPATGFDMTVVASIVACIVAFIAAVVLMMLFGKDSIPGQEEDVKAC